MALTCEARIPTYRRPEWLRRALDSLRSQTHSDWRAVVLDDSPDREAEAVVREIADERIAYRANAHRLGAAGNIDQAFSPAPFAGGDFVFILEDDAALRPECLRENLRVLAAHDAALLLRNQAIYAGEPWRDTGETTRGEWLDAGRHEPLAIQALLFFMEGVSNGGLFWRSGIDLTVGPSVSDAGLQELCRTLLVREPLVFASEPLAIFTRLPSDLIQRSVTANRVFARGAQSIRRHLLAKHGGEIVRAASALAKRTGRTAVLAQSLGDAGRMSSSFTSFIKGTARHAFVADPVAEFLRQHCP